MKKQIYILGNFGYQSNNLNGQTMRTRSIYESLKKRLTKDEYQIKFTDTSISYSKIKMYWYYIKGLYYCITFKIIILMPAQKAIKYTLPFFYYLNFILKKDIHFIAIGGWLAEFLENNRFHIKYLKNIKSVYVQTESLKKKLESQGLDNVVYFPNFRLYKNNHVKINDVKKVKRLVFFSRVIKEKGIEIAISAIKKLNKNLDTNVELHIYGPIRDSYNNQFEALKNNSPNIFYRGILEPEKILAELHKYDFMIFPTYYNGEGFPGTILDAMSSGVPIIASDWKYNSEILKDGYTGLLFKNKDVEDLVEKINFLMNNTSLINQMKINCIDESKKYEESKVIPILIENLL